MTQQPDPEHIDPVMADPVEPAPTISRRRPDDHIRSDQARWNMTPALLFIVLLLLAGCFLLFLRGDIFFGISQGAGHWFRPKCRANRPQWPTKPPIATLLGCELIYVRRASATRKRRMRAPSVGECGLRSKVPLKCGLLRYERCASARWDLHHHED